MHNSRGTEINMESAISKLYRLLEPGDQYKLFRQMVGHGIARVISSNNLVGWNIVHSTLQEGKRNHLVPLDEILNHLFQVIPLCKDINLIKAIKVFLREQYTLNIGLTCFSKQYNLWTDIYWLLIKTLIKSKEVKDAYSCATDLLTFDPSPSNYLKISQIFNDFSEDIIKGRKIKIALLSNFTTHHLKIFTEVKCWMAGISPQILTWNFSLAEESVFKEDSDLYQFCPNLIVIAFDNEFVNQPSLNSIVKKTNLEERENLVQENVDRLFQIVSRLRQNSMALIIVHNFAQPPYNPLGIIDLQISHGYTNFWQTLNMKLTKELTRLSQVVVLNLDNCFRRWGWETMSDERFVLYSKSPFSFKGLLYLADEYLRYIKPLLGLAKKCIVVDLDNTLWGGVVGEDGISKLEIGETPLGLAYTNFQRALKALTYRGIFLAIISKNNFDDAIAVFRQHPHMILKEKDFVAMKINWNEKWVNMKELSQELNIGLDAIMFLDDNPMERVSMSYHLPEVLTPDLPSDPTHYTKILWELPDLEVLSLTGEDLLRTGYYQAEQQRKQLLKSCDSMDTFLTQLCIVVEVFSPDDFSFSRIAQLINRTNQFNMTTKRYTQAEVETLIRKNCIEVYPAKVSDNYGDFGIIGLALILKEKEQWIIDNFLLSCRVLGRGIEQAILSLIAQDAIKANIKKLIGLFVPTGKNSPAKDFYLKAGFIFWGKNEKGAEQWVLEIQKAESHCPSWINLIDRRMESLAVERETNYVAKAPL